MSVERRAKAFVRLNFFAGALLGCGRIGCVYGFCSFLVWQSSRNAALAIAYLLVGWACCFLARKLRLGLERAADESVGRRVAQADEGEQWQANGFRAAGGLLSATLLAAALPLLSQSLGFDSFAVALAGALIAVALAAQACAHQADIPPRPDWLGHWAVVRLPLAPRAGAVRGGVRLIAGALAHGAIAAICVGAFVATVFFGATSLLSLFGAA